MKHILLFLLSVSFSLTASAASQNVLLKQYGDRVFNLSDYQGETFLTFLYEQLKLTLDEVATKGYEVASPKDIEAIYEYVDTKIQSGVDRNGGIEKIKKLAGELQGQKVTMNDLPQKIAEADRSLSKARYDISTFLGLASGGGAVVKFYKDNYSYNVHYDTTNEKSGRSFSVGPTRPANDVSYKVYLDDLDAYARKEGTENLSQFYEAVLETLLDSNSGNYANVIPDGQTTLSDFLSVYIAEQTRNLMDNNVTPHWDAALLEVTLLASFHAGQSSFKLIYFNPATQETSFTGTVMEQARCEVPTRSRKATMRDYWQYSRRVDDEKNCGRSGVNITKDEFRKLETEITSYMRENNPKVVQAVEKAMGIKTGTKNLYQALSQFIVNGDADSQLGNKAYAIAKAWTKFLDEVTASADGITKEISSKR
jgi:hypothetical protein